MLSCRNAIQYQLLEGRCHAIEANTYQRRQCYSNARKSVFVIANNNIDVEANHLLCILLLVVLCYIGVAA